MVGLLTVRFSLLLFRSKVDASYFLQTIPKEGPVLVVGIAITTRTLSLLVNHSGTLPQVRQIAPRWETELIAKL